MTICDIACAHVSSLFFSDYSFGIHPAVGSGMLSAHWWDDKLSLICPYLEGAIK